MSCLTRTTIAWGFLCLGSFMTCQSFKPTNSGKSVTRFFVHSGILSVFQESSLCPSTQWRFAEMTWSSFARSQLAAQEIRPCRTIQLRWTVESLNKNFTAPRSNVLRDSQTPRDTTAWRKSWETTRISTPFIPGIYESALCNCFRDLSNC